MLDVIIGRHTWILLFSPYGERVKKYAHIYIRRDTHTNKIVEEKKGKKGKKIKKKRGGERGTRKRKGKMKKKRGRAMNLGGGEERGY